MPIGLLESGGHEGHWLWKRKRSGNLKFCESPPLNPSLCAWCTVRPNKLKHWSLEQTKIYLLKTHQPKRWINRLIDSSQIHPGGWSGAGGLGCKVFKGNRGTGSLWFSDKTSIAVFLASCDWMFHWWLWLICVFLQRKLVSDGLLLLSHLSSVQLCATP